MVWWRRTPRRTWHSHKHCTCLLDLGYGSAHQRFMSLDALPSANPAHDVLLKRCRPGAFVGINMLKRMETGITWQDCILLVFQVLDSTAAPGGNV